MKEHVSKTTKDTEFLTLEERKVGYPKASAGKWAS